MIRGCQPVQEGFYTKAAVAGVTLLVAAIGIAILRKRNPTPRPIHFDLKPIKMEFPVSLEFVKGDITRLFQEQYGKVWNHLSSLQQEHFMQLVEGKISYLDRTLIPAQQLQEMGVSLNYYKAVALSRPIRMHAHAKKLLEFAPPEAAQWNYSDWGKWCQQIVDNPRHPGFRYLACWQGDHPGDMLHTLECLLKGVERIPSSWIFGQMTSIEQASFQAWLKFCDYEEQLEAMRLIAIGPLSKLVRAVFLRG